MPNNNNGNNNNNLLGHNINFNDAPNVESGLGGYFTGNAARNEFSNKFWDDQNGYLSTVTKELDNMLKQYRELTKYSDQMTKSERQAVRERQRALKEEAKILKNIKDQQDVSAETASGVIKEATNLLTNSQAGLAKSWNTLQDKTDDALKNVEKASNHYTKLKDDFTKMNKEMGNLIDTANKASDNFASSLSTTLNKAGDKLASLSNMFSLSKIANNTAEQNARSIEKIQSDTMKQFGFTSNSQYWNFVDSLNSSLKSMNSSMGNLFNNNDLKTYMSNLGAFGITDTKMAQQQMKNSILATKYLGVTAETQSLMFKYMKRTNNNDVIEKHNQMIVGLLQSQLGVSKEQLDVLSQKTYEDADALAALGVDQATQQRYIQEATASKAAMDSITNGWGDVLGNVFNEMIAMPYDQMIQKYGKLFGSDVTNIYDQLVQGNAINATKMIARNNQLRSLISGSDTKNVNTILNALGVGDQAGFVNMMRYFGDSGGMNTLNDKLDEAITAIKNTGSSDVDNFVEKSTEATLLEKIENWLSTTFGTVAWKAYPVLATAAFSAYLASGAINLFQSISKMGGISKFFGNFFGKGSTLAGGAEQMSLFASGGGKAGAALGGLATGAAVVGLTTAAMIGIGNAVQQSNRTGETTYEKDIVDKLKSQGSSYANNKAWTSAVAAGNQTSQHNWFSETFGNVGGGFSTLWANMTGKSHIERNKAFLDWAKDSGSFGTGDTAAFNTLAYYYLLDEVDSLASVPGLTHNDLKQFVKDGYFEKWNMQTYIDDMIKAGWHPEDINHNKATGKNTIDRYLKAGLNWVPRDGFRAMLHKGEMVLNEREANAYRQFKKGYGFGGSLSPSDSDYVGPHHSGYAGHNGIDLYFGDIGTPVGSAVAGKVIASYDIPVNWNDGKSYHGKDSNGTAYSSYGRVVKVLGDDGHTYIYAHLNERKVNTGDIVSAGTLLGYSGTTGNSSGPHLHFEVAGAGTGEANHAEYYTPYVRNVLGTANSSIASSSSSIVQSGKAIPVATTRFVPKAFQSSSAGGFGGMEESVSKGVNNGIDKLIGYLEGIRSEQDDQRKILEAFSKSRVSKLAY